MREIQRILPWFLLSAAVVLVVILGSKHRSLRDTFLEHRRDDMRIQAGSYLPAFMAASVTGDTLTVGGSPEGGRQVLLLLTSTCPYCRETLPYWKRLTEDLRMKLDARLVMAESGVPAVQVVALTTDSMEVAAEYARASGLPFSLVPFLEHRHAALYRGFVVPQTVVIDSDGRVLFARGGVLDTPAALDSVLTAALAPLQPELRAGVRAAGDTTTGALVTSALVAAGGEGG